MKANSKFLTLIFLTLILSKFAFAASGHDVGIPWELITAQSVNFAVFFFALVFLLRKPIAAHFTNFRNTFLEQSSRASEVAAAAERQKKEIEDQLKVLETTYSSKIESSKKEAQALRQKIVSESQERSQRLIADTNESANLLFRAAEQNIKSQILEVALKSAKTELTKKVDVKETERLHGEFLEEISVGSV